MTTAEIKNQIDLIEHERNNLEYNNNALKVVLYRIMTNNHTEPIPPDVVDIIYSSRLDIESGNHIPVCAYRLIHGTDVLAEMYF